MLPPMWPRPTKPIVVPAFSGMSGALLDQGDVVGVELEARRRDDRIDLVCAPEADDRSVHRRVAQRPGDGHGPGRRVVALADDREALDEREVARELRLGEGAVA